MKKILKSCFLLFAAFGVVALLTSTSIASPATQLIGKWYAVDDERAELEFFDDQTFTGTGIFSEGNWNVLKDGRVKLKINLGMGMTQVLLGKMEKGKLILKFGNQELFFQREQNKINKITPTEKGHAITPTEEGHAEWLKQYASINPDEAKKIAKGEQIYKREGCANCHTMTLEPQEKIPQQPHHGYDAKYAPGLANIGDRNRMSGYQWRLKHLLCPSCIDEKSTMPSYDYLIGKAKLDKYKANYTADPAGAAAFRDYLQDNATEDDMKGTDMDALIWYLLSLKYYEYPPGLSER